jgi:hypothetical protein
MGVSQLAVSANNLSYTRREATLMREPTRRRREGMGRLAGYARVSPAEQDLGLQLAA